MAHWVIIKFVALPTCIMGNFVTAHRVVKINENGTEVQTFPVCLFNVNECLGIENALLTLRVAKSEGFYCSRIIAYKYYHSIAGDLRIPMI